MLPNFYPNGFQATERKTPSFQLEREGNNV